MEKKAVIFGGTGFIGQSLAAYLKNKGWSVVLIARNPVEGLDFPFASWDGSTVSDWKMHLEGATAIVNLAGRTVDCVKTPKNCDQILRSRVNATKTIGQAIKQLKAPPKVWVQMSTAHIYGDSEDELCTEESTLGYGLAPFVGRAWEEALAHATLKENKIKTVILRTSFVLGKKGGALKKLSQIVRLRLGGKVGSGKQGVSWIHELDMNRIIYKSITEKDWNGVIISSAPKPVSNASFMKALRKALKVKFGLPSFNWMVNFGAKHLFKSDPEIALYGRYVKSARLEDLGFQFKYTDINAALSDIYN